MINIDGMAPPVNDHRRDYPTRRRLRAPRSKKCCQPIVMIATAFFASAFLPSSVSTHGDVWDLWGIAQ